MATAPSQTIASVETPAQPRPRRSLLHWINTKRLFKTRAFRHAVIYAMLFIALSSATLGFIYWSTRSQLESQVDTRLRLETDLLLGLYESGGERELLEAINSRNQIYSWRFYALGFSDPSNAASDQTDEDLPLRVKSTRTHTTRNMGDVRDLPPGSSRAYNPVRVAETELPNGLKLSIGLEVSDEQALLDNIFSLVVGAIILTLSISLIGGVWIGAYVLRRIDSVNHTASEIMSGDLSRRLTVTARNDEFDEVSEKINQMLNRIEDLMSGMQQVTNNVAHDLRSPLTRLRNRLEVTLLEERDSENYRTVMDEAIGDADSLIKTFNSMMSIARLEAGVDDKAWATTNIGDLVSELAELYEAVAEDSGLAFNQNIKNAPNYYCNSHLIAQCITNLLDNSFKYTEIPGKVELLLEGTDEKFTITVSDNGPGIPIEERERVFNRFVRLENERNSPGNGLGLSLVKAVVRIHGASLELEDNGPGLKTIITFKRVKHSTQANAAQAPALASLAS